MVMQLKNKIMITTGPHITNEILITIILIILTMIQPEIIRVITPVMTTILTHILHLNRVTMINPQELMTQKTIIAQPKTKECTPKPKTKST